MYYDDKLMDCMPDPLDYRENTDELKTIYFKCRNKADKFASEKLADLKERIREYAKKFKKVAN